MTMHARPSRIGAFALALIAALPLAVRGQDLPPAQEVIDRYVEAIGGRAAATAEISTQASGSFEVPAMGLTGTLVTVNAPDGAMAMKVTVPGMGDILSGYTGEVGWSMDPMTGARLLEGGELTSMEEQADPRYRVRDAALFQSVETVGENEFEGDACWEVQYTWISGRVTNECFSKDSGLMVASISMQESPMGEVEVVSLMQNYEQFGDLLYPTLLRQQMMGQEQVMRLTEVRVGDVDLQLLVPPTAIQTLIDAGG
ncbi:hypothetical protein V3331_12085 [Gaopeijia maritima]|uniref:hypothetical protein n=1 Tax=Gaopeijia maritima TaxID=3119007 RepID=UPI003251D57A